MSATNRGAERRADDYYATPAWATAALLDWFERQRLTMRGTILDPFAGDGAILEVVKDRSWPWVERLAAVEIRPEAEPALRAVAGWHRIADWFELVQVEPPVRRIVGAPHPLRARPQPAEQPRDGRRAPRPGDGAGGPVADLPRGGPVALVVVGQPAVSVLSTGEEGADRAGGGGGVSDGRCGA